MTGAKAPSLRLWPAIVTVTHKSGKAVERFEEVPGDPSLPFDEDDVKAKFMRLVGAALGAARAERMWTLALDAHDQPAEAVREIEAVTTSAIPPR